MIAVKRIVKVQNPHELVLHNLPFPVGQLVEVVMLAEEGPVFASVDALKALFVDVQALPQAHAISDEEIADEIEAYRVGLRESTD